MAEKSNRQPTVDFFVEGHGSVYLLRPVSSAAYSWIDEHLPEDRMTFGGAVCVEHRFIRDIVGGIIGDGLSVR